VAVVTVDRVPYTDIYNPRFYSLYSGQAPHSGDRGDGKSGVRTSDPPGLTGDPSSTSPKMVAMLSSSTGSGRLCRGGEGLREGDLEGDTHPHASVAATLGVLAIKGVESRVIYVRIW